MLLKNLCSFLLLVSVTSTLFAQQKNSFLKTTADDNVVMTWNKDTPESEMKDDVKALAEKGITITYSDVKRNVNKEITGLKVAFADRKGNKGSLAYDKQNPIDTIVFYNQDDKIGFGEPSNSNQFFAGTNDLNGISDPRELLKQFQFNNGGGDSQSYSFSFPDGQHFGKSQSQIRIQKEGKKPLVIENGEITEGGDDYSKEELDEIKKSNKIDSLENDFGFSKQFDFRNENGLEDFKNQMQKLKEESQQMNSSENNEALDKVRATMQKAKEDMLKAREELEKSRKELEKTRSNLKTQKS